MRSSTLAAFAIAGLSAALLFASASDTKIATPVPPPPNRAAIAAASASASTLSPELKGPEYTENDFVESDRNRDPFRSFLVQNQQYSVDELKLVAIVTGGDQARAMFVDPTGKGTVVYKGSFVCRPEVVHIGGTNGPEYQLNWRVDRIREADVVLIREDPAQPAIPPATRVIPLHPEAEKQAAEGTAPG
jgi:type IV pilus assembly protein PilP